MAAITEPTPTPTEPSGVSGRFVFDDVPYAAYEMLRDSDAHRNVLMTYHDGTLELMSPEYVHELNNRRLAVLVREVAVAFDLPCADAGSTTFRRPGRGPKKGSGREADTSFYLANEPRIRGKTKLDLAVDPPPGLAIEVDHSTDSEWKLPVFADLDVPEIWRCDVGARTLWFGSLQPDGTYAPIDRSLALPMLTRAWVLDALSRCVGENPTRWNRLLRDWIRDELGAV